ncbi:hypothetical protein OHD16_06775 [Sphingobacterium sp. ML3W]|uniref:hypothetical protein n=1 Tax=Sphingobacterium sp. ML3W TaxID=1538644 RepID=UPI00249C5A1E|nr:hypothetical protein [Sphingobacterium sp. ML3W]WFA79673.1 hypothetical protein OGI71_27015 [Sphingobacterium sp. ML3W]
MKSIMFRCLIDGCMEYVDISRLYGGGSFQVMINNFFITSITKNKGEWDMKCNNESWITTDELTIFMDHFDAEIVFEEEI